MNQVSVNESWNLIYNIDAEVEDEDEDEKVGEKQPRVSKT